MNDSAHIARTNIQRASNIGLGHFLGKSVHLNRNRVCNAPISNVSSFCDHVSDVVAVGSEKQVIWSDAGRIIARVKNLLAHWNWSEVNNPAKAMSEFDSIVSDPFLNSSIALRESASPKDPASIALNDSTPKSGDNGWRKSLRNQVRKTINRFRHFDLSCIDWLRCLGVRNDDHHSDAAFFLTQTS